MKERRESHLIQELVKIIDEKQRESLKNMNCPINKEYWFGRSALCSELLKMIRNRWNIKV